MTPNPFDQFDQQQANPFDQFDAPQEMQQPTAPQIQSNQVAPPINLKGAIQDRLKQRSDGGLGEDLKVAHSAIAGINSLFPALAGLPIDTVQNIINLGITAYGGAKAAMGADVSTLPETMGPLPWGSQDIERRISEGMGGSPFAPSENTPLQQNVKMASSIMGAGALTPAKSVGEVAQNITRMAPSAAGAITGKEMFPDEPLAPMVGMVLGGAVKPTVQSARASAMKPKEAFLKARKLGYRVPPVMAKPTKTQQFVEGAGGPVPTKQKASIYNQKITNNIIKKDLGYPRDAPLSSDGLDAIRRDAGKVYDKVGKIGKIKVDNQFNDDLANISTKGTALAKEIPGLAKKNVDDLVSQFNRDQYSSSTLVEAIKQLRADSKTGFKSQDPSVVSMAKAQGKISNAIEGLMERNLATTQPDLLPEFKAARQKIAKTYTVEKALKGENVDAVALGRELDKGKPLSGAIKDAAEFGQNFKGAAQVNPPQQSNFRPMDLVAGIGGAAATSNPAWLLAMAARPATRSAILSKAYQTRLARVYPKEIADIQKLPPDSQVVAITSLLEKIRGQDTGAQNQPQQQESK